jgi:hypothetical protein
MSGPSPSTLNAKKRKLSPPPRHTMSPQTSHSYVPQYTTPQPNHHLQINYLARRDPIDLPIISATQPLTSINTTLHKYSGIIERHESVAANLGCKPLGQILIKRVERLFDGPVRVVGGGYGPQSTPGVSWLDVSEWAKSRPGDFRTTDLGGGQRVVRFSIVVSGQQLEGMSTFPFLQILLFMAVSSLYLI